MDSNYVPFTSARSRPGSDQFTLYTDKNKTEGKVKFTQEQAMKAQRGSRGIAVLFL
jgi:hypothetical protein